VVNAIPIQLAYLDGQYGPADDVGDLAVSIAEQVEHHRPEFVVGPLGVHHPDHVRVRNALLSADLPVPVWLNADLPYSVDRPQEAEAALEALEALEQAMIGDGPLASKSSALMCYPSQMRHYDTKTLLVPERFWRVN
jgi:hypothetical protein